MRSRAKQQRALRIAVMRDINDARNGADRGDLRRALAVSKFTVPDAGHPVGLGSSAAWKYNLRGRLHLHFDADRESFRAWLVEHRPHLLEIFDAAVIVQTIRHHVHS